MTCVFTNALEKNFSCPIKLENYRNSLSELITSFPSQNYDKINKLFHIHGIKNYANEPKKPLSHHTLRIAYSKKNCNRFSRFQGTSQYTKSICFP